MNRPRRSAKPVQRFGSTTTTDDGSLEPPRAELRAQDPPSKEAMELDEGDEDSSEDKRDGAIEDGDDSDEYCPSRPAKRARRKGAASKDKPAQTKNRIKGKLGAFAALPVDVLLEVAHYVDPIALISLSRTNKTLRAALIAKSAAVVWASVRDAAGMPAMTTGKMSARDVILFCYDKNVQAIDQLRYTDSVGRPFPLSASLVKYLPRAEPPVGTNKEKLYAFVPSALALNDRFTKLSKRAEIGSSVLAQFWDEYVAYTVAALQDSLALRQWFEKESRRRQQELRQAESARQNAIIVELQKLGYDPRDLKAAVEVEHLVLQPRPLTAGIWKRISTDVIAAFEAKRDERLKREQERQQREQERQQREQEQRVKREQERVKREQERQEREKKRQERQAADRQRQEQRQKDAQAQRERAKQDREAEQKRQREQALELLQLLNDKQPSTLPARYAPLVKPTISKYRSADQQLLNRCVNDSSASMTGNEYTSFFAPYIHFFSCRLCHPSHELFFLPDFLVHKVQKHERLDKPLTAKPLDKSGHDRDTYYDANWVDTLVGALKEAGLPPTESGAVAIPKLEAFGQAWMCDDCKDGGAGLKFTWGAMVKHVFQRHRGTYQEGGKMPSLRVKHKFDLKLDKPLLPSSLATQSATSSLLAAASAAPVASTSASQLAPSSSFLHSTNPSSAAGFDASSSGTQQHLSLDSGGPGAHQRNALSGEAGMSGQS
ncbi:hypothetical protein JCM6882_001250 [Rhodosporidiobolus microsporus]